MKSIKLKAKTYVDKVKKTIKLFYVIEIERIPQEQNSMADALAQLATIVALDSFGPALTFDSLVSQKKDDENQRS